MKLRKPTVLGLVAVVVILGGGYAGGVMPLQAATASVQAKVDATNSATQATLSKVPQLKSQLKSISGDVASLRTLSAKVPAKLDMPGLLSMMNQVATAAGVKSVQDVSVTAPALVTSTSGSSAPAPAAEDSTSTSASAKSAGTKAATPAASTPSVIASYDVSMKVTGTLAQEMAFLNALHTAPRLSVVRSTTLTVDKTGLATMDVRATFFLQQVDVEGMAQSIEQLARSLPDTSGAAPTSPSPSATPTSGAPTPAASSGAASPAASAGSPSATARH